MSVNLKSLIGKLNHETRSAVEAAAGICLSRTHYDVEIEHFLMKLLDASNSDAALILKHFGVDRARFSKELTEALDRLKTGNARTPSLSPSFTRMISEAWLLGSVDLGADHQSAGADSLGVCFEIFDDRLQVIADADDRRVGDRGHELHGLLGDYGAVMPGEGGVDVKVLRKLIHRCSCGSLYTKAKV